MQPTASNFDPTSLPAAGTNIEANCSETIEAPVLMWNMQEKLQREIRHEPPPENLSKETVATPLCVPFMQAKIFRHFFNEKACSEVQI